MKNKIRKSIFITLMLILGCSKQNPTFIVGEAIVANISSFEEDVDLEYIWEFSDLPDNSRISNSDISAGDDNLSISFTPDVSGIYSLEVSVFQYNDEINTQFFNFEVLNNESLISEGKEESNILKNKDIITKNDESLYNDDDSKWFDSEDVFELVSEMEKDTMTTKPEVEESSLIKIPSAPKKVTTKNTPVKTRGQSIPYDKNRFTIQISSKKELSDAKKVAVNLIDAGYDAYIQKALFKETNEIWYRIRIGSYQNKETAIAVAESLSRNRPEKAWVDYVRLER